MKQVARFTYAIATLAMTSVPPDLCYHHALNQERMIQPWRQRTPS